MIFMVIYFFILGLIFGSFINCLVWRIHKKESLMNRSYCPKCKQQIAWHDNLPVLSFIVLRAKCRHCQKRISWQYPLVELITGILFAISFQIVSLQTEQLGFLSGQFFVTQFKYFFLIFVMICLFVYDLRWYTIPDVITLPSCIIFLFINLYLGFGLVNLLITGLIGAGFFLFQFLISKGKWMGGGDIRVGLLMGLAFGRLDLLIAAIFLAYIIGSVFGITMLAMGKKEWGSKLPLGTFLAIGTIAILFWGEIIINWYWRLL